MGWALVMTTMYLSIEALVEKSYMRPRLWLTQTQLDHSEYTSNAGNSLSAEKLAISERDVSSRTVYH